MSKYSVNDSYTEEKGGSKWITPLSLTDVTITSVEFYTSKEKGTPGIRITVREEDNEESPKCEQTYWLTEGALENTKRSLSIIANRLGVFDRITADWEKANSDVEFVEAFKKACEKKRITILFAGEQNFIKDDETNQYREWIKPVFNAFKFASAVNDAEKKAELQKYLEKNKDKMIKKAPVPQGYVDPNASQQTVSW